MPARIRIDASAVRAVTTGPAGPVYRHMEKTGRRCENRARVEAPVDTGLLRASHEHTVTARGTTVVATFGSGVNYAANVYHGHGPITAPPGKRLVFMVAGRKVFARHVRAQPANRWLDRACTAVTGLPVTHL